MMPETLLPPFVESFVMDGRVTLAAVAVLALEALVFIAMRRRDLLANAFSGLFLILALRAAIVGDGVIAIALWLSLGFIAHVADLVGRFRGRSLVTRSVEKPRRSSATPTS